jgi:hypothetical protein
VKGRKPRYVCIDPKTSTYNDQHVLGASFSVSEKGSVCACSRCGVVYWLPPKVQALDQQCQAWTRAGKRCKLDAISNGFCANHLDQGKDFGS